MRVTSPARFVPLRRARRSFGSGASCSPSPGSTPAPFVECGGLAEGRPSSRPARGVYSPQPPSWIDLRSLPTAPALPRAFDYRPRPDITLPSRSAPLGKRGGADESPHLWPEVAPKLLGRCRPECGLSRKRHGHVSLGLERRACGELLGTWATRLRQTCSAPAEVGGAAHKTVAQSSSWPHTD